MIIAIILSIFVLSGQAHRDTLNFANSCMDDFRDTNTAFTIPNPEVSWMLSHYYDCHSEAVWFQFTNPGENWNKMYFGAGVILADRFANARVHAVLVGPGLPTPVGDLPAHVKLPDQIKNDPNMSENVMLLESPQDQSTCAHLCPIMQKDHKVIDGRCAWHEQFTDTEWWWVSDHDEIVVPQADATYYIAAWVEGFRKAKVVFGVGYWAEDFSTPYADIAKNQERSKCPKIPEFQDFSEKVVNEARDLKLPGDACIPGSPPPNEVIYEGVEDHSHAPGTDTHTHGSETSGADRECYEASGEACPQEMMGALMGMVGANPSMCPVNEIMQPGPGLCTCLQSLDKAGLLKLNCQLFGSVNMYDSYCQCPGVECCAQTPVVTKAPGGEDHSHAPGSDPHTHGSDTSGAAQCCATMGATECTDYAKDTMIPEAMRSQQSHDFCNSNESQCTGMCRGQWMDKPVAPTAAKCCATMGATECTDYAKDTMIPATMRSQQSHDFCNSNEIQCTGTCRGQWMDKPVAPKPVTEPPVVTPDPCGDNGLLVANPTENMWKDAVDGQERGCGNWGQLNKEQRDYKTKVESEEACMQRCLDQDWCLSYFWGFDKHAGKCILVGEPQCTKGNTYQPYRHKKMNRCTKREMPEETDAPAVTDAPVVTEPVATEPAETKKPEPTMPEEVCDEDRATGSFVAHGKCKGGRKLVCTQAESRYDCMMMAKMDTECSSVYSYYRSKSCFCQKKDGSNPECQMMEDRQYGIWRLN